jgi:hypothetical protein
MTINTTITLKEMQENIKNTLKVGMKTNFGTFMGFDEKGFALFSKEGRSGWAGPKTFHFIQILEK